MLDRSGAVRPHWQRLAAAFAAMGHDEYQRRLDSALRMVRENGVTYNVYDEASGLGRLWQLDIAPFVVGPGRLGRDRGGRHAARPPRERDPARHLRRATAAARRRHSAAAGAGSSAVLARAAGRRAAGRRSRAPLLGRSGARQQRLVDRAREPRRRADRLGLRARKPRRRQPNLSRTLRRTRRSSPGDVLPALSRRGRRSRPRRERPRGAAHAGVLQRGVLRARLPRAVLGSRTGRGRRSFGARRDRLPAHARRPRARRGHLPPARFRLRRSVGIARAIRSSACRVSSTRFAPETSSWPTRWAAASSNRRRSTPTCRTHRARCSARSCCSPTFRPCGAERRGAAPRASPACRRGIVRNAFDAGRCSRAVRRRAWAAI